jgi:hypothetical protein
VTICTQFGREDTFCPECGKENKDDASSCIHCGESLRKEEAPVTKKTLRGKSWKRFGAGFGIVVGVVLVIVGIVVAVSGGKQNGTTTENGTATNELITKDASEMVLAPDDFESGWTLSSSENTTASKAGSESAYKVLFYKSYTFLRNEVAVYPSIDSAKAVYSSQVPTTVSLEHPSIGDECFLDASNPLAEVLVFRKENVVVWVSAILGKTQPYAMKVEAKIS